MTPLIADCPECTQGKHVNCTGNVLAEDDSLVICPCRERGHR